MSQRTQQHLRTLKQKYYAIRMSEIVLTGTGVGLTLYGILIVADANPPLVFVIPLVAMFATFIVLFRMLKLHTLNAHRIVAFINRQYPSLQQSTDLLLKDDGELTSLQRLQKEKISTEFSMLYPAIQFPHHLVRSIAIFILGSLTFIVLPSFKVKMGSSLLSNINSDSTAHAKDVTKLPALVQSIRIRVQPPLYTGKSSFETDDPNLTIAEGSTVQWAIHFTNDVQNAQLVFSGGDSVQLTKNKAKLAFAKSSFYQLKWEVSSGATKTSDYYKIEIITDDAPNITVHQLPQFTELSIDKNLTIPLRSTITDDYSIKDAYIIATVSKGSGESVKFREEKLNFTSPSMIKGSRVEVSRRIDLLKLGLEPGDELYFYVEARDNKSPTANRSRTETFFISLRDTTSQQLSIESGLGVDLMPEYFRSQRQIIIDSERLLRERKHITKQEFNSRSNELGYDQKVLRLKYGEFLGEEFESAIGPGSDIPVEEEHDHEGEEEDPTEKYGHVHDKDNEHNLVPEKKQQAGHTHEHSSELDPDKKENPADAYKHQHDDPEEATFFTQSIRAKLKAALTVMWDAELHLRMFDPEKSLPYQYTALRLLKEISNDSRIYVHKTGFDPPPIKEEKRLSGDLSEIKSTVATSSLEKKYQYPRIRAALKMVEQKIQHSNNIQLTSRELEALQLAGNELSALALEQPAKYLPVLSKIKAVSEQQSTSQQLLKNLMVIRKAFWQVLPKEAALPDPVSRTTHRLDREFIQKMDRLKND